VVRLVPVEAFGLGVEAGGGKEVVKEAEEKKGESLSAVDDKGKNEREGENEDKKRETGGFEFEGGETEQDHRTGEDEGKHDSGAPNAGEMIGEGIEKLGKPRVVDIGVMGK